MNIININVKALKRLEIQFLFITANEHEKKALESKIEPLNQNCITQFVSKNLVFTIGYFGSYLIAHTHCLQQGSMKSYASTLTIQEAYDVINPVCVVMLGIAYGIDKRNQSIGDVLISCDIQPYHSVRRSTSIDGKLNSKDRNITMTPGQSMLNQVMNLQYNSSRYKVFSGTILTGEELIDNEKYRDSLIKEFKNGENRNIIGGEMEAAGLTSVLHKVNNKNWIVIKAICDFADGNKDDNKMQNQIHAANNAVDFCFRFFKTEMPSNIQGFKRTVKNYNENMNDVTINGYHFFMARNEKCISFKSLANKTRLSEKMLREFENFLVVDNKPMFHKTTISNYKKIQNVLDCDIELSEEFVNDEAIHFFLNKQAGNFCPTKAAKIVIFDFDGTLTEKGRLNSTWQTIWSSLGYDLSFCDILHRKFTNGEISHYEWCQETAEYFKKKRLSRAMMIEISKKIVLMPGIEELLSVVASYNIPMYICSGSIDIIIRNVLGDLTRYFKDIVCNEFAYDENADLLKSIIGTKYDFVGKKQFIEEIAHKENVITNDILYIGNSNNDESVVKSGAKTLVVNPILTDAYNRKIWRYYVGNIDTLTQLLPYILPNKYNIPTKKML